MATIASLVVNLAANSARLVKDLAKSRKSVNAWVKKVRAKMNTAAKYIAGLGTAGAAMVLAFVNKASAAIDALAKTSAKLGIATQALQKLRYQAELSGVASGALEMALQRMVRRVAEAAKGTGTAVKALKEMGLNAKNLSKLSPDQMFYSIAQAMKKVKDQSDRVRLAFKLFDSGGVALVNTLTSDLKGVGEEFDRLGVAITKQQAAMVEKFNDSKSKLATIWEGFINQITIQVAPYLEKVINYISESVQAMGGMGRVATAIMSRVAKAVGLVTDVMYGWKLIILKVQQGWALIAHHALKGMDMIHKKTNELFVWMGLESKKTDLFSGLSDSFMVQAEQIEKRFNALLKQGRPSMQIEKRAAQISKEIGLVGVSGDVTRKLSQHLNDLRQAVYSGSTSATVKKMAQESARAAAAELDRLRGTDMYNERYDRQLNSLLRSAEQRNLGKLTLELKSPEGTKQGTISGDQNFLSDLARQLNNAAAVV